MVNILKISINHLSIHLFVYALSRFSVREARARRHEELVKILQQNHREQLDSENCRESPAPSTPPGG